MPLSVDRADDHKEQNIMRSYRTGSGEDHRPSAPRREIKLQEFNESKRTTVQGCVELDGITQIWNNKGNELEIRSAEKYAEQSSFCTS